MEKNSSGTTKGILRNVFYGFSTWILPLTLSLIATPILVNGLGHDDYGIYALVLGFIGYSFNLNIGRAITKYIAEYQVSGETHKINDVISTTLLLNLLLGIIGVLSICLMANWLVTDVFLIGESARGKTVTALYFSAAIIFVTMLNQVFNSILQGLHRFDTYSKIFNASSISVLVGNIIIAYSGFGLIELLIWNLFVLTLICVILAFYSKKFLPEFRFSFALKPDMLKQIVRFSSGVVAYQILANVLLLFERGWIIRKLGEESLTYYVVAMILGINIHAFISSLLLMLFPLTSSLSDNREKLKRLYLKATKIVCFLVVFLCLTIITESKVFLTLWMGSEFADKSWYLLILHVITFSMLAIKIVTWQITEGLGYPSYNFYIFIFCLAISIPLMIVLVDDYGSFGVAIARLSGFTIIFLSIFHVEKMFFGAIQLKFWLKLFLIFGTAGILASIVENLVLTNLSLSWIGLILTTLSGGIVYCIVLWLLGFVTEDEKLLFRQVLKR